MAALYMVIDVSSVTLTKILKIAPLHEAGLWGRLFKHEGHSVIGPPIEGRGFSKLSLEQLQYLYWNTFQDTPSSDYATLLASCLEKVKKLPVDETGLHTLERRAEKLGIQVRIDESENKLVAKIPTYDTMSAPTTIPVGETKMNDQFNPLDAALAQIESGEAVGAAEVESELVGGHPHDDDAPAKKGASKKKAAAPKVPAKKVPAKEVLAKKETEKKPVDKKEAVPAKKAEPKKAEVKKAAAAPAKKAEAKKAESKKPVAEKKAAPKKAEAAPKKAVKAEAPKKAPAKKAAAKPVAKKEKQPTQGGFTRPAPGTLTGKFWDICDAAAKTKAGAVRADVIKKGIDKLGVSPGTASTQFFRWRAFNGLTAK